MKFARAYRKILDRKALRSIARTGPDAIFAAHIQAAIPRLQKRGLLRVIKHSDGDYVELMDKGWDERMFAEDKP